MKIGRPTVAAQRGMPETVKWCPRCQAFLDRGQFGKHAGKPDGLTGYCLPCKRTRTNEWWQINDPTGAKEKAYRRQHRQANLDRRRAQDRATKRRELARDPEYVKRRRKQWETNRRDVLRAGWSRGVHARRARMAAAPTIAFTQTQLVQRLSMIAGCWICGGSATAVDHVKPIAKGGAHALCNLRPICRPCNSRKRDRWPYPTGRR